VRPQDRFRRLLLVALLAVAAARLLGFVARFGGGSLQADFSAYYTAGEALNRGLSPYRSHPGTDPPVWDGVSRYRHSRFLYPPLVATLFRPWALLPYPVAKQLWMLISLAAVAAALVATGRALGFGRRAVVGTALWACLFHPLLTLLERGQIDAVTLLLVALALTAFVRSGDSLRAGVLLGAATLLKLNVAFFLPFLLAARRWRAVGGYVATLLGLAALSLVVDGREAVTGYVRDELPRIAAFGEGGPSELLLPPEELAHLRQGTRAGDAPKDGRVYAREAFGFVANASLARVMASWTGRRGESPLTGRMALGLGLGLLLVITAARPAAGGWSPTGSALYWQAVMVAVLICGPLTWVMNLVWLLPVGLLLWRESLAAAPPRHVAVCAGAIGLLLASLPDRHVFPLLAPYGGPILDYQYVLAEVLVVGALVGLLWRRSAGSPDPPPAPAAPAPSAA
jgi:hypothetical protein